MTETGRKTRVRTGAAGVVALALPMLPMKPANAATTGAIALRGFVSAQAIVTLSNLTSHMSISLDRGQAAPVSLQSQGNVHTISFAGLANSPGGFNVSLRSESAAASGVTSLTADDGTATPYEIKFGGTSLRFDHGTATLAKISRHDDPSSDRGEIEIVAPPLSRIGPAGFTDRLILTITAR